MKTNLYDTIIELIEFRDRNIEDIETNPFLKKKLDFFDKFQGVTETPSSLMIKKSKIMFEKTLLKLIANYEKQIKSKYKKLK